MSGFSSDTTFKLKALGIYQLSFAIIGVGITFRVILQVGFQFTQITIVFFVVMLIFLPGIYSGIACIQKKQDCLLYSSIYQYLQLLNFEIAGYGFRYDAGLSVDLGFDLTTGFMIRLKMEILSFWHVDFNNHSNVILVNLNLLALALILVIDQLKKQKKNEMEEELLTIGDNLEQRRR